MPTRRHSFVNTNSCKESLDAVIPQRKTFRMRTTINTPNILLELENFMVALVREEPRGMDKSLLFVKAQSYALEPTRNASLPTCVFERILKKCQFTPVGSRLIYNEGCPIAPQIKGSSKGRLFRIANDMDCIPKPTSFRSLHLDLLKRLEL